MRKVFYATTIVLLVDVLLQFYFATVRAFSNGEPTLTSLHPMNGFFVIPALALLVLVVAASARVGRRAMWLATAPLGIVAVQLIGMTVGPTVTGSTPPVHYTLAGTLLGGFHAVLGAGLLLSSVALVRNARALVRSVP